MFFVLFLNLECCILFKKVKTRLFNRYLFSIFCVVAIAVILVTLLIFTIYANLQVSSARTYSVHQFAKTVSLHGAEVPGRPMREGARCAVIAK